MYENIWNHDKIAYGGDYNPEQWPEEIWVEDMRLFKLAGIDTVTLNVFSWAALQPQEDVYDFSKLDKIMALCREHGLKVILATSTAAHPAWMATKYPEILRVEANGMKRRFGARHNSCPNSPIYRKYSVRLAEKLAQRYGTYDNIIAWHISNEYGGECYCDNCANAFRNWLKNRYGSIDEVNRAWNTAFWSHTFYEWEEIVPPDYRSEHFHFYTERTNFQGISIDYKRFNSDSILQCCVLERDAVKTITPNIPVTTNFMEFFKTLDYGKWAKELDFVSWDSYPHPKETPAQMALNHELMRGLKAGRPFALMEQTPSVTNWQPINSLKRPGVMRLWSYQAIAHGADSVLFFQMRRSIGACEKLHGAVIDHCGHENTRVFREVAQLGHELEKIGGRTLGSRTQSEVAILFDWENWWAVEYSAGPSCYLNYHDEVQNYYTALHSRNIPTDIVGVDADLNRYKVIIAPMLYMIKPGVDEKLRRFVEDGGTFITTFLSGYVDESDLVTLGGYPGKLRELLGIWVEEIDALPEEGRNYFTWNGQRFEAKLLCDLLHCESAEVLAAYEEDFYAGMPALTYNRWGRGNCYYVATQSTPDFYIMLLDQICQDRGIKPVMDTPHGVEACLRRTKDKTFLFLLNHNKNPETVLADRNYWDVLTNTAVRKGDCIHLDGVDARLLEGC